MSRSEATTDRSFTSAPLALAEAWALLEETPPDGPGRVIAVEFADSATLEAEVIQHVAHFGGSVLSPTHAQADSLRAHYFGKTGNHGWKRSGLLRQLRPGDREAVMPYVARGHNARAALKSLGIEHPGGTLNGSGNVLFGVTPHLGIPAPKDVADATYLLGLPDPVRRQEVGVMHLRYYLNERRHPIARAYIAPRRKAIQTAVVIAERVRLAVESDPSYTTRPPPLGLRKAIENAGLDVSSLLLTLDTGPDGATGPLIEWDPSSGPLRVPVESALGRALLRRESVSLPGPGSGSRGTFALRWPPAFLDLLLIGLVCVLKEVPEQVVLHSETSSCVVQLRVAVTVAHPPGRRRVLEVRTPWTDRHDVRTSWIWCLHGAELQPETLAAQVFPRELVRFRVETSPGTAHQDHARETTRVAAVVARHQGVARFTFARRASGRIRRTRRANLEFPLLRRDVPRLLAYWLDVFLRLVDDRLGEVREVVVFVPGLLAPLLRFAATVAESGDADEFASRVVEERRLMPVVAVLARWQQGQRGTSVTFEGFGKSRGKTEFGCADAIAVFPFTIDHGAAVQEAALLGLDPDRYYRSRCSSLQHALVTSFDGNSDGDARPRLALMLVREASDRAGRRRPPHPREDIGVDAFEDVENALEPAFRDLGFKVVDLRRPPGRPVEGRATAAARVLEALMSRHGCSGAAMVRWIADHRDWYERVFGDVFESCELDRAVHGSSEAVRKRLDRAAEKLFVDRSSVGVLPGQSPGRVYEVRPDAWKSFAEALHAEGPGQTVSPSRETWSRPGPDRTPPSET